MNFINLIIPAAQAHTGDDYLGHHMGMMSGWGYGGLVLMVLFWSAIIVGIVAMARWLTNNKNKTALEILQERYAKGEIDKKEFEEKKKDLAIRLRSSK